MTLFAEDFVLLKLQRYFEIEEVLRPLIAVGGIIAVHWAIR